MADCFVGLEWYGRLVVASTRYWGLSRIAGDTPIIRSITDENNRLVPHIRRIDDEARILPSSLLISISFDLFAALALIPFHLYIQYTHSTFIYINTSKGIQPCLGLLEKVLLEKAFFFWKKGMERATPLNFDEIPLIEY